MSRVLVVEDEQHLAEGLRFNLEQESYEVQVVDNGEAALELLVGEKSDIPAKLQFSPPFVLFRTPRPVPA